MREDQGLGGRAGATQGRQPEGGGPRCLRRSAEPAKPSTAGIAVLTLTQKTL